MNGYRYRHNEETIKQGYLHPASGEDLRVIIRRSFIFPAMCLLLFFGQYRAQAQDVHSSQFYETAILRNPALLGIHKEDYKITGQYRSQWSSISKGFRTGSLQAALRIPASKRI